MRVVLLPVLGFCAVLLFIFAVFSSSVGRSPVGLETGTEGVESDASSEAALETAAPAPPPSRENLATYARCFQSPIFSADDGSIGACAVLHKPTDGYYKWPTEAFRKVAKVTLDPSRCTEFLTHVGPAEREAAAQLLKPFTVDLRPGSTDHDVFLQVYCGGPRGDFGFLEHLAKFLPLGRPVTILDAGANIGGAAILFAQLIAFSGEVLAVDANPMTYELLEQNIAPWKDSIIPVKTAIVADDVARTGKTISFSGKSDQYWGFFVDHGTRETEGKVTHEVETKSLPMLAEMTRAKHFDFVKIDIEGEEKHILRDPETAKVLCASNCIFMELHDRFEPGCKESWQHFQAHGCAAEDEFQWVVSTGEYLLFCKKSIIEGRREP